MICSTALSLPVRTLLWLRALVLVVAAASTQIASAQSGDGIDFFALQLMPSEAANDVLSSARATATTESGPELRVGGGTTDGWDAFQEVVRIDYVQGQGGLSRCTGVVVSPGHILTAGHCSCGSNYRISHQKSSDGRVLTRPGPISVARFPGYRCDRVTREQPGLDLALISTTAFNRVVSQRSKNVTFEDDDGDVAYAIPTLVAHHTFFSRKLSQSVLIAGFGRDERGVFSDVLRIGATSVFSPFCRRGRLFSSVCAMHREFALKTGEFVSAGRSVDTCGGDSGGPVFFLKARPGVKGGGGSKVLLGITSRAISGVRHPYPGHCGGGGIYTALGTRAVLDWLQNEGVVFDLASVNDLPVLR